MLGQLMMKNAELEVVNEHFPDLSPEIIANVVRKFGERQDYYEEHPEDAFDDYNAPLNTRRMIGDT